MAPRFYYAPNEPQPVLKTVGVICMGAIPMIVVGLATAPFVNSVNLYIPEFARRSRDVLIRYSQNLPKDAQLEFVTARLFGLPKTTGVRVSEIRALPSRWGRLANLERIRTPRLQKELAQRSAWKKALGFLAEPRFKFYVTDDVASMRRSRAPGVWENVLKEIRKSS